jgi:hypothetical protein
VFSGFIDRVGKYQLTMQKVCAYRPFAQSMPPMLREEAFHLAAGVVPMRRWLEAAAQGDAFITPEQIQQSLNKWIPRGLEMFGDERGGDTNLKFGFKDLKNREAQDQYLEEVRRMVRDINLRFIRARFPAYTPDQAEAALADLESTRGVHHGVRHEDLLRMPDRRFFRRKGETAFAMVGLDGESFADAEEYLRYLSRNLNEGYVASRDMKHYAEALRGVATGALTIKDAIMKMPKLKRVGGTCPCSKGVRWVMEGSAADQADLSG